MFFWKTKDSKSSSSFSNLGGGSGSGSGNGSGSTIGGGGGGGGSSLGGPTGDVIQGDVIQGDCVTRTLTPTGAMYPETPRGSLAPPPSGSHLYPSMDSQRTYEPRDGEDMMYPSLVYTSFQVSDVFSTKKSGTQSSSLSLKTPQNIPLINLKIDPNFEKELVDQLDRYNVTNSVKISLPDDRGLGGEQDDVVNYLVREGFQAEHVREGMEIYGKDIQKVKEYASLIEKYNRCGFPHTQICAMILDLHLGKDAMVKSLSLFAECHKRGHTGADFSKAIVLVGLEPETVLPFLDGRRRLLQLGYSENLCIDALLANEYDVARATRYLMSQR